MMLAEVQEDGSAMLFQRRSRYESHPFLSRTHNQTNIDTAENQTAVVANTEVFLHHPSRLSRTHFRTRFLNSAVFSLHKVAASIFAGDSSLGLESMDITERRMVSGV